MILYCAVTMESQMKFTFCAEYKRWASLNQSTNLSFLCTTKNSQLKRITSAFKPKRVFNMNMCALLLLFYSLLCDHVSPFVCIKRKSSTKCENNKRSDIFVCTYVHTFCVLKYEIRKKQKKNTIHKILI